MTFRSYYLTTLGEWRAHAGRFANSHWAAADARAAASDLLDSSPILAVVDADEGAHLALEQHPGFQALPHPLSEQPASANAVAQLAGYGVTAGANTFDVTEAVGRAHPLLRYRAF